MVQVLFKESGTPSLLAPRIAPIVYNGRPVMGAGILSVTIIMVESGEIMVPIEAFVNFKTKVSLPSAIPSSFALNLNVFVVSLLLKTMVST